MQQQLHKERGGRVQVFGRKVEEEEQYQIFRYIDQAAAESGRQALKNRTAGHEHHGAEEGTGQRCRLPYEGQSRAAVKTERARRADRGAQDCGCRPEQRRSPQGDAEDHGDRQKADQRKKQLVNGGKRTEQSGVGCDLFREQRHGDASYPDT